MFVCVCVGTDRGVASFVESYLIKNDKTISDKIEKKITKMGGWGGTKSVFWKFINEDGQINGQMDRWIDGYNGLIDR